MLFNSHEFLFVFLPATLLGFYLLGRVSRQTAILWLILTSLLFYGWWRPLNILIIGPSIIINYALGVVPAAAEPARRLAPPVAGGAARWASVQRRSSSAFSNTPTSSTARSMTYSAPTSF